VGILYVQELVFTVRNTHDRHDLADPTAGSLVRPDNPNDEVDGVGDERTRRRAADFRDELFQESQARARLAWYEPSYRFNDSTTRRVCSL